jgi:hypothetical protein
MKYERPSTGVKRCERWLRGDELQSACTVEAERLDDVATDRSEGVAECRSAEARRKLQCGRGPANCTGRFQQNHGSLGPREDGCGDQSIQTAANNHYIRHATRSPITFMAALRPGAAMMPPPGWVADPHMYSRPIGVR